MVIIAPAIVQSRNQSGFALVQLMVAILLALIIGVYGSGAWIAKANDAAAEATGRYLVQVRNAALSALTKHLEAFTLVDTSGAPPGVYPVAPAWANFSGASTIVSVDDLKSAGFLNNSFPGTPPLGRSVHVAFIRSGTCPGDGCSVTAYAFTCWPISKGKAVGNVDTKTCPVAPANWQADSNLAGAVIQASNGYAGTNTLIPSLMRGALFSVASADLGLPATSAGHVALVASLSDSMYPQFVRQGDTRHIYLKDHLTVGKQLITEEGLLMATNVAPGSACTTPNLFATSNRPSLVQCMSGSWVELNSHMITSARTMANGETVIPATCPSAQMEPFSFISMQNLDTTMTGSDIAITGTLGGAISGTGNVSSSGAVSVSGTFSGTTTSTAASAIRVAQSVAISGSTVVITPPSANARALVIQGCRYL